MNACHVFSGIINKSGMRSFSILLFFVSTFFTLSSCEEGDVNPVDGITIINLGDSEVLYNQSQSIDVDGDGDSELTFVTVLAQENNTNQLQFRVFPIGANRVFEAGGRALMLNEGQEIVPGNPFEKNVAPLVAKVESNGSVTWQGDWLNANNHYLGFQIQLADGSVRYGWVRLSFNQASEKLIIHELAYRHKSNTGLRAGQTEIF